MYKLCNPVSLVYKDRELCELIAGYKEIEIDYFILISSGEWISYQSSTAQTSQEGVIRV